MTGLERAEVLRLLEVEDAFLESLEREAIVRVDVGSQGFSPRMVERIRVAHSLVFELEVNLSGVAVILRMREDLAVVRSQLRSLAEALDRRGSRS